MRAEVMVKLTGVEVSPSQNERFVIVTGTTPGEAMSDARMVAEAEVVLGVVVKRLFPLNEMIVPVPGPSTSWQKPLPETVSVKLGPPAAREDGLNSVMTGCANAVPDNRA